MSTILYKHIVFGPFKSRRLGNSLGVNLLPRFGKWCSFDCIYCECGWNRDGREDTVLPTAEEVRTALEYRLKELKADNIPIEILGKNAYYQNQIIDIEGREAIQYKFIFQDKERKVDGSDVESILRLENGCSIIVINEKGNNARQPHCRST